MGNVPPIVFRRERVGRLEPRLVDVELGMNSDCLEDELDAPSEVLGEAPDADCSVTTEDCDNALRAPKRVRDAGDKMRMTLTMLPSTGRGDLEHGGASWGRGGWK